MITLSRFPIMVAAMVAVMMAPMIAGDFANDALSSHNAYRQRHGCPGLQLSSTLNNYAQQWANYLAATDTFEHSGGQYGENLYASRGMDVSGNTPVDSWYAEIVDFDFSNPNGNDYRKTGHFTQVVWKSSKRLGIAKAKSSSGWTYVCASYDPRGNYQGQYAENVPPPNWLQMVKRGSIAFSNASKWEFP